MHFDVYFDYELCDFVPNRLPPTVHTSEERDDGASSRMTFVVDSLSYAQPSYDQEGSLLDIALVTYANDDSEPPSRTHSAAPPRVSTPIEEVMRRTQPPKWPQHLLDVDISVYRRAFDPIEEDPFGVDEEERVKGKHKR